MFYSYFSGRGREILADVLDAEDPFGVAPADLVERILSLGYTPEVTHVRSTAFRTLGQVHEVEREEQTFIVAVSRDAEEISMQEMRADAYDPVE